MLSLIPTKYLVPTALLASVNKRVIIPTAKKVATSITTGLGILSAEEAHAQEKMFDEMLFPISGLIDSLEEKVIEILAGTDFTNFLNSWRDGKKKHAPTEISQKEDSSAPPSQSALKKNVGDIKSTTSPQELSKEVLGRLKKNPIPQKSSVSAQNIDMSLFNALEHSDAHKNLTNPIPGPEYSGAPAQSLAKVGVYM